MLGAFFFGVLALQISDQPDSSASLRIQGYSLSEISASRSQPFGDQLPASLAEADAERAALELLGEASQAQSVNLANGRSRLPDGFLGSNANAAPAISLGDQQLLRIDFDLGARGGGNMQVSKAVMLNGRSAGTVNVAIDRSSQLHLSSHDLAELLPDVHPVQELLSGEYVTFDLLRSHGLEIRYDPVSDALVIGT